MKKLLAMVLALAMVAAMAMTASAENAVDYSKVKIGVILLHDDDSTYDRNFHEGIKEAAANLGLSEDQVIVVPNIPESNDCYEKAMDLVDEGCTVIFADSFGHETFLAQAASENPDVQFCHATGTTAHTLGLDNFHNAFASIYD